MTHPYFEGTRYPRVLAHRGFVPPESPEIWENTAAAFAAAQALGVEYLESDCQVTADGELVLFHDETLTRLTGDTRRVDAVPHHELAEIFAAHGGLLTVAEALEAFPEVRFNLDVKTDAALPLIGKAVSAHTKRVLLTSFSDARRRRAVAELRRAGATTRPAISPGQKTIATLCATSAARLSPAVARLLRDVDALQIPLRHGRVKIFTNGILRQAHTHGVEVHIWTINDAPHMRELVDLGVDGIVTDRADLAVTTLF